MFLKGTNMKGIFQKFSRQSGRGGLSVKITSVFFCAVMTENPKEQVKILNQVRESNPTGSFEMQEVLSYESVVAYNAAADERKALKQQADAIASVRKLTPAQLAAARAMTDEQVKDAIAAAEIRAATKAKAESEAKAEAEAEAAKVVGATTAA